jgi:hypothetical protein
LLLLHSRREEMRTTRSGSEQTRLVSS